MENQVARPTLKIQAAMAMLKDFWGIELNENVFLEWADDAARRIGYNIDTIKISVQVAESGAVYLPCDATMVHGVTSQLEVFNKWNALAIGEDGVVAVDNFGTTGLDTSLTENIAHGDLVDFQWDPVMENTLLVSPALEDEYVYVLVDAKVTDEEGLPMLNKKQAKAVADWCAHIYTMRNAMAGIGGLDPDYMRKLAERAIASARVPDHVSDNEWDKVLDAKVSMGRKHFNRNHAFGS